MDFQGRCIMAAFLATSAMNLHPESENSLSLKLYPSLVLSRAAGVRKRRQLLGRPKITSRKFRSYHRHKDWTNLMFDIPARFRKELIKFYNKSWPSKSKTKIGSSNKQKWLCKKSGWSLQNSSAFRSPFLRFRPARIGTKKDFDFGCPAVNSAQTASFSDDSAFIKLQQSGSAYLFKSFLTGSLREDHIVILPSSFWKKCVFCVGSF